jgi:two-component system, chemotaxis family, chemotaxis protein CheY
LPFQVLVVDDDPSIRDLVCTLLDSEGYNTAPAVNGAHALTLLESYPAQLILLDMRMPVMDGWTFAREARAQGITTPIIVMTAAQDANAWGAEVGATGVLAKPFDLEELLQMVERHSS